MREPARVRVQVSSYDAPAVPIPTIIQDILNSYRRNGANYLINPHRGRTDAIAISFDNYFLSFKDENARPGVRLGFLSV